MNASSEPGALGPGGCSRSFLNQRSGDVVRGWCNTTSRNLKCTAQRRTNRAVVVAGAHNNRSCCGSSSRQIARKAANHSVCLSSRRGKRELITPTWRPLGNPRGHQTNRSPIHCASRGRQPAIPKVSRAPSAAGAMRPSSPRPRVSLKCQRRNSGCSTSLSARHSKCSADCGRKPAVRKTPIARSASPHITRSCPVRRCP